MLLVLALMAFELSSITGTLCAPADNAAAGNAADSISAAARAVIVRLWYWRIFHIFQTASIYFREQRPSETQNTQIAGDKKTALKVRSVFEMFFIRNGRRFFQTASELKRPSEKLFSNGGSRDGKNNLNSG